MRMYLRAAALLPLMVSAPALAQTESSVAQPLDPNAAQDGDSLSDIVVTATRREETLQSVPASIGIATDKDLASRGIENLKDLAQSVAGLTISSSVGTNTVFIRGVGGGGRNIGFGTRVGIYLDGVYVGQTASIDQSAVDIARVEILRGPQGTTFGRNNVSGALSIITKSPDGQFEVNGGGEIGSYNLREARIGANIPISTDQIALRISAVHSQRDGFTRNIFNGRDLGNFNRDTARARLRFELSPDAELILAADYTDTNSRFIIGEDISGLNGTGASATPDPFVVNFNSPTRQNNEFYGGSATLDYKISTFQLTSITALRRSATRRLSDNDYSPLDILYTTFDDSSRQFTQELRVATDKSKPISAIAGLYYFDETSKSRRAANLGVNSPLLNALFPLPFIVANTAVPVSGDIKTQSYAAFGSIDVRLAERMTLTAGARFTTESIDLLDYSVDGRAAIPFRIAFIQNAQDSLKTSRLDPSVALRFELSHDANAYLKFSQGFKSGGYNVDFVNAQQFASSGIKFQPERAQSFEAGLKLAFFDNRARLNMAAYLTNFSNYQINQFVDLGGGQTAIQLRNAAQARTYGGEAELQIKPMRNVTFGANLALSEATFRSFPNGGGQGVDLAGNRLPQAPRFTSSVYVDAGTSLDFLAARANMFVEYNHRSTSFSGPENLPRQALGARDIVNARLGLSGRDRGWSVEVFIKNLFDEQYLVTRERDFFGTLTVERGDPRTYGATLRFAFR